jgi:hypothetical protein
MTVDAPTDDENALALAVCLVAKLIHDSEPDPKERVEIALGLGRIIADWVNDPNLGSRLTNTNPPDLTPGGCGY